MRSPLKVAGVAGGTGFADVSSSVPFDFIEDRLKQSFAENIRPVGYGLSFLYLFFALAHPYALGREALPLVAIAILSAIVFALIAFRVNALALSDAKVTLISLVYVFLVLVNSATHLAITGDAKQTTNFMLLIVAAGSFYLSRRKLALAIALVIGSWWAIFVTLPVRTEMPHYVFALFTATVISFLIVALRRRALVAAAKAYWRQQQNVALVQAKDEELQKTNLQLEDRVRARTMELEEEIEKRRIVERAAFEAEKLAATGRMAATIAHEINNPLEGVGNLLYLIESTPGLPEETVERARIAQQELGRVSHIAKQTLSFYRESGRPGPFDVCGAVREVIRLYEPKARNRKLQVEMISENGVPTIEGFLGEFRQVASNLLLNAIDATPSGGTIRVRVKATLKNGESGVRVTFADPGAGIARDVRAKIFQPFFTTKEQKGTGLGLWVALGIVSRHGGTIQIVSSTRGERHGTCVSVWLPAKSADAAAGGRRRFEKVAGD